MLFQEMMGEIWWEQFKKSHLANQKLRLLYWPQYYVVSLGKSKWSENPQDWEPLDWTKPTSLGSAPLSAMWHSHCQDPSLTFHYKGSRSTFIIPVFSVFWIDFKKKKNHLLFHPLLVNKDSWTEKGKSDTAVPTPATLSPILSCSKEVNFLQSIVVVTSNTNVWNI